MGRADPKGPDQGLYSVSPVTTGSLLIHSPGGSENNLQLRSTVYLFTWKMDNKLSLKVGLCVHHPASRTYLVSGASTGEVAEVKVLRVSIQSGHAAN